MKMHRAALHADWTDVTSGNRTWWQNVASQTGGWITPGNVVSFVGLLLTLAGVLLATLGHYGMSVLLVGIGRCADVLDGTIADRTCTKSRLGEAIDAGIDKIELLAVVIVAVITQIVPLIVVLAILMPNAVISAMSLYAKHRNLVLHPSRVGKLATAVLWAAIWMYLLRKAFDMTQFLYISTALLSIALGMVTVALVTYARQVVRPKAYQAQSTLQR